MARRILNLYAGIGGNRALWPDDIDVTAVEYDKEIAAAYSQLWPNDEVIVTDAHKYLERHALDNWDFIWSSPPCQTHSRLRILGRNSNKLRYPHIEQLYGEICLLKLLGKSQNWVVENVIPYYEALVPPTVVLDRHSFWIGGFAPPNFFNSSMSGDRINVNSTKYKVEGDTEWTVERWQNELGFKLPPVTASWSKAQKIQVLRNCVMPRLGAEFYRHAFMRETIDQPDLFAEGS
jgi:DNA (cytosine-5)-methyltransferase 1